VTIVLAANLVAAASGSATELLTHGSFASWALMLTGLAAMGAIRRNRRRPVAVTA
jgi:hypothetical protein